MAAQQTNISTIRTSTQKHLDIQEITDDIVILKDGSGCLVLAATAINFSLLSEEEQEAIIYAYAAILNSLTYPIQILIHSERKDISDYLKKVKLQEDTQSNKLLKEHIRRYRRFVEETVQRNNVLDKQFYIIIPFTALELGSSQALFASISGSKKLPFPISYIIEKAKNHLHPKRDHLIRQFTRLGIRLAQLSTPELIELFYRAYNPDLSRGTKLEESQSYATPIVQGPANLSSQLRTKVEQFNQNQLDLPIKNTPPQSPTPEPSIPEPSPAATEPMPAPNPIPPQHQTVSPPNPTSSSPTPSSMPTQPYTPPPAQPMAPQPPYQAPTPPQSSAQNTQPPPPAPSHANTGSNRIQADDILGQSTT